MFSKSIFLVNAKGEELICQSAIAGGIGMNERN